MLVEGLEVFEVVWAASCMATATLPKGCLSIEGLGFRV